MIYIVGKRSNLSRALGQTLKDTVLVSIEEVLDKTVKFEKARAVIFNNFQKATLLNDISSPAKYVTDSILSTAVVLEALKDARPSKVIYTSSAAVYGNNIYCKEEDVLQPLSLHAALKAANEKLIERFCVENEIDFTVTRVFNLYGGDDQFSVISKLLRCAKEKTEFTLVNNGNAIRDFVHIDDVVNVYTKILSEKSPKYLNIASGSGVSIGQMIDFLMLHEVLINSKVIYKDELKISTASIELLSTLVKVDGFRSVYEFIKGAMGIEK